MHKLTNKEAWGLIGSADTEEAKQYPDTQSALAKLRMCTNDRRSTARIDAQGNIRLGIKGCGIAKIDRQADTEVFTVGIRRNYFIGKLETKFRGSAIECLAFVHGWLLNDHNVIGVDDSKFRKAHIDAVPPPREVPA